MRKHRKKLSILLILALLWTIAAPGLTFAGAEPAKELYMRFNPAVYIPPKVRSPSNGPSKSPLLLKY